MSSKNTQFKKGHKLSPESIAKMIKSKTKYTPEEKRQREKDRSKDADRIEWTKNYYNSPKRKYATYKLSAKKKNIEFDLSFDEFMIFWESPCTYCKDEILTIGLDRVDSKLDYTMDNIVACCKICNYMKRDLTENEFFEQCCKIIKNLKA